VSATLRTAVVALIVGPLCGAGAAACGGPGRATIHRLGDAAPISHSAVDATVPDDGAEADVASVATGQTIAPPKGAKYFAVRSAGPFDSVESACSFILEQCDPSAVPKGCTCSAPRVVEQVAFIRTTGWCNPIDREFECAGGGVDRHYRVLLRNSHGLWISAVGFSDGRQWAGNGDGYSDYEARKLLVRPKTGLFVDVAASMHRTSCECCTNVPGQHSPLPVCAGIKTRLVTDTPWKATIRCRDDVTATPWCFRADDLELTAESGVLTRWNGDALVVDHQDGSEPEVVDVWFPPSASSTTP